MLKAASVSTLHNMICALKGAAAIQDCHSNARRDNGAQTDAFMHHGYDIYNTVTDGPTKKPMTI